MLNAIQECSQCRETCTPDATLRQHPSCEITMSGYMRWGNSKEKAAAAALKAVLVAATASTLLRKH